MEQIREELEKVQFEQMSYRLEENKHGSNN